MPAHKQKHAHACTLAQTQTHVHALTYASTCTHLHAPAAKEFRSCASSCFAAAGISCTAPAYSPQNSTKPQPLPCAHNMFLLPIDFVHALHMLICISHTCTKLRMMKGVAPLIFVIMFPCTFEAQHTYFRSGTRHFGRIMWRPPTFPSSTSFHPLPLSILYLFLSSISFHSQTLSILCTPILYLISSSALLFSISFHPLHFHSPSHFILCSSIILTSLLPSEALSNASNWANSCNQGSGGQLLPAYTRRAQAKRVGSTHG